MTRRRRMVIALCACLPLWLLWVVFSISLENAFVTRVETDDPLPWWLRGPYLKDYVLRPAGIVAAVLLVVARPWDRTPPTDDDPNTSE